MDDKELLTLAAKAAGYKLSFYNGYAVNVTDFHPAQNVHGAKQGNPLTDDADALRLAVKLKLFVDLCYPEKTCGWVIDYESCICQTLEQPKGNDPYAATRRAIVRAAAEIGRSME